MKELLIMRHAKSAWDIPYNTDFERPLNKRGREAAPKVGRFLANQGLTPDHVVSSPAERARQTVTLVCEQLQVPEDQIDWDSRVYHAGVRMLIQVLKDVPKSAQRVLLVGHNPGFERLLQHLCDEPVPMPDDWKLMPTARFGK